MDVSFETFITPHYSYDYYDVSTEIARFLDPAWLYQRIGVSYRLSAPFTIIAGEYLEEIYMSKYTNDPYYSYAYEKQYITNGLSLELDILFPIMTNITLKSQTILYVPTETTYTFNFLDYFSNNELDAIVNRNVSMILTFRRRRKFVETTSLQLRQGIKFALIYKFW